MMLRKLEEIGDHPVLKVKLGLGTAREQIETIETIRRSLYRHDPHRRQRRLDRRPRDSHS